MSPNWAAAYAARGMNNGSNDVLAACGIDKWKHCPLRHRHICLALGKLLSICCLPGKAAASTLRLLAAVVKLTVLVFWISAVVQLALLAVELLSESRRVG